MMTAQENSKHPRDISEADLRRAAASGGNAGLLSHLVELSRRAYGFYPSYFPYTITYPWVAERLQKLGEGSRVLDIGAGLSPVPLFLAERDVEVDCVDNSRHVRTPPSAPDWNEWGFLDYRTLHPYLTSYHCDVTNFTPTRPYEAAYSIAALAHMPRATREIAWRNCHEWLVPKGLLLLTIDIIPATDFIWNRSEGLEVEPPIRHGTIDDVLEKLKEFGFRIDEFKVVRSIYKARTDLLCVSCCKDDGS